MEKLIKTFIRDDSFDDPINQEVLEKLRAWLVAGLGHSRVIKDPAENRLFTLKAARRLDWRRKNRLCVNQNCQPWREYKRAIDAMIEPSQGCRRLVEPSPHAGGSGVPPVPPPPPPSPIRGPKKKFTPVQKRPGPWQSTQLPPSTKTCGVTSEHAEPWKKAWQSRGTFAKKRAPAMKKYLERVLEEQPDSDLKLLVSEVTSKALQGRCDWGCYVQTSRHSRKLHVICRKNPQAAKDLEAAVSNHVSQKAEEIVAKALEDLQEVVVEGPPDRAMAMSSL